MNQRIKPALQLDDRMPLEDRRLYKQAQERSKPLRKNQLNLLGVHLQETTDHFIVKGLIRSTVQKPIIFKQLTPICLFDDRNQLIVEQNFDLSALHPIQPNEAYPFTFNFSKDQLKVQKYSFHEHWKLTFKQKPKHSLDLSNQPISKEIEQQLQKVITHLGPPKDTEVNIVSLSLSKQDNGNIKAIILIRNGTSKPLSIKQLPLQITSPTGKIVAQGTFPLKNLIVKPQTSKPAAFVFPKQSIQQKGINLTKCKISTPY